MADWLNTPVIVLAVLAVAGTLWGIVCFIWKAARWTAKLDAGERDFRAFTQEIRGEITTIKEHIIKIFEHIPPPKTIESASPLRLSELGKVISKSLKAAEWAARIAPGLVPEVAGRQPFEIDRFSDQYVETRLDAQDPDWVARQAYESGVTAAAVRAVLRVVLHDELIQRVEQDRS